VYYSSVVPAIPLSEPYLGISEALHVWKAVRSGWLTQNGQQVKLMEANILSSMSIKSPILDITTTSNGTHALHLALLSLDVGPGDLVGVPDFCYVAVANAVLYCGATPVLIDVEIATSNICVTKLSQKQINTLKAIIIVDNYGVKNDIPKLRNLIGLKIPIIYDVAESFPECTIDDKIANNVDIITGSFYANKVFTSGEGGFIATNSSRMLLIRKLKNQGQTNPGEFKHDVLGFNYRITNIQAAVFNAQWKKRKKILTKRYEVFNEYGLLLDGHPQIKFINRKANPWLVAVRILRTGEEVEILRAKLSEAGIETRPGFQSFHNVNYISKNSVIFDKLDNSVLLSQQIICLPTFPHLRKQQIKFISRTLIDSLNGI
jgi:perosamine synthetase